MNVGEYVKLLLELPQDLPLVVDGYEGGVDEARKPRVVHLRMNVNCVTYYGDHEIDDEGTPAVYVGRPHAVHDEGES